MKLADGAHLTYCTNIHPGEAWSDVLASLTKYLPLVRDQVAPNEPFGVGLRLSAEAADTLAQPARLTEFRRFLADQGFYVFTLNGFPYGAFHGVRVKERVYEPDWRHPDRLRYTNLLADILAQLLPSDHALHGTVSTVPGAYKPALRSSDDVAVIRRQMVRHVAHLVDLERRTGRRIQLALEPEPCCLLETIEESVDFFRRHLFGPDSVRELAALTGTNADDASAALRAHLGLCLDLCHAAVEFEDPNACLARLSEAGIAIGKLQISAGLSITSFDETTLGDLRRFADPVYLHQVVESGAGQLRRHADLPDAFDSLADPWPRDEWRVHFHVPVFQDEIGAFRSTRRFVEEVLRRHRAQPVSSHLEVETYTWDVLPATLREASVDRAIARELNWVREILAA